MLMAQNAGDVTRRNLKALQLLGLTTIVVVVAVIILKVISGEIEASTFSGGFEITLVVGGSIVPAAVLIILSALLKQQRQWHLGLKLGLLIAAMAAGGIGAAVSGFLATRSLLTGDEYMLLYLIYSIPPVHPAELMAVAIVAAMVHYGVVVLYIVSLPASIKNLKSAIEEDKASHGPPVAKIIPSRHPGVTSNFCRQCGALNDPQAQFCASCGGSMY
jgi:hypothetical protein